MGAANWTAETAKAMSAKAIEAKRLRAGFRINPPGLKEPVPGLSPEMEQDRREVQYQIRLIDQRFRSAPMKLWPALTQAKARLWELLYPKPGSLKPRSGKRGTSELVQPLS